MALRHLRYFLAVAETGNATRAAARCFVAQSALSAQISHLEHELGSDLFVRSARGMRLTPAGEALRPLAARLVSDAALVQEEMAALAGVLAGRLRLGSIQGLPAHLDVVNLIAAFHREHAGVELRARTGASEDLAREVLEGGLDVAVVALRAADLPASLVVRPLFDDPLVAVVRPADLPAPQRSVSVQRLVTLGPFIHYRLGSGLRRSVTAAFERAGVTVDAAFELDQIEDMVRLAAQGVGVTIVPASAVGRQRADGRSFRTVALADRQALHTISTVTAGPPSPAARAFLALLEP